MPTKVKYRRGTSYKVSFPTAPSLRAQPSNVELLQEAYSHDILKLEFFVSSSLWFDVLKTGTPVVFTWKQNGEGRTWVGYVNFVSKQSAAQKKRTMLVVCVGATYVLKQRAARVFKNKTITEAASQIAKEFGFDFIGAPSGRRFETLSMAGESYWEWLQKQAKRIGYGFTAVNCTLIMRPLDSLIDAASATAPVFTLDPVGPSSEMKLFGRTLDSLTVLNGEFVETADTFFKTKKVTAGVNPITSGITGSTKNPAVLGKNLRQGVSPALFTDFSDEVVHSKLTANKAAEGEAQSSRLGIYAETIGQGDYRVAPFSTIFVEGTGTSTDGYWVVITATHSFKLTGEYTLVTQVRSDGLGAAAPNPLRRTDGGRLATVNLNEKVLNMLKTTAKSWGSARLVTKQPVMVESQQGFVRLGSVWRGI